MKGFSKSSTIWMIIIGAFFIGIWLENDSGGFYDTYLSPIANFKLPVMVSLLILAAVYQYYSTKLTDYEKTVEDYELQIRDGSRALWKYFKDISEIKVRDIVQDVMHSFTIKHSNVLAVQIYEYSVSHLKKHTQFTLNHKYSYVSESTDINALLQTYYKIPKEVYDEYILARTILDEPYLIESGIEAINSTCEKYLSKIKEKELDEITEEDSVIYALIEILLDILSFRLNSNFSLGFPEDRIRKLEDLKRTGILKGIELKDFYTFEYKGEGEKSGRKYLTKVINDEELLNGIPHIILITLNPDYLPEDEEEHKAELKELGDVFNKELQKELKLRYNDLKDIFEEEGA